MFYLLGKTFLFEEVFLEGSIVTYYTLPLSGIPQAPVLLEAFSSSGEVTIEVATNESGTTPPNLFAFNVKAERVGSDVERLFTMEAREYRDGTSVQFHLSGFSKLEEGATYVITVSCANSFGTSEDSNQLSVVLEFNPGIVRLFIIRF